MAIELFPVEKKFDIDAFCSAYDFKWDQDFVFNGESHDPWEIVFVVDGFVEVTEDEKIYRLESGNIILHAPNEFHRIRSIDGSSPRVLVTSFNVSGELPPELENGVFILESDQCSDFHSIFNKIHIFLHGDKSSDYVSLEASALLCAFLIRLSQSTRPQKRLIATQSASEYRKAVSAMANGICMDLTLEDIARECNVSVSYIKLLFSKYAGISPKKYYSGLRIRHACSLLDGGMSVSAVAEEMCFSSPNYFCVFFKRNMGISPMEYQKK